MLTGSFMLSPLFEVAALARQTSRRRFRSGHLRRRPLFHSSRRFPWPLRGTLVPLQPFEIVCVGSQLFQWEEIRMRKALAILATVATVGATTMSAPAEARGWRGGWGPGIGFGLAAGALTAGALAAGAYGPGYGYSGYPAYYDYGPGPYAYYGGPDLY